MLDFTLMGQVVLNGLTLSSLYVLMALGFSLIFGVLRIVNFSHGSFYMLGAFFTYSGTVYLRLPYAVALFLAVAISGALGAVAERLLFRPHVRDEFATLVISFGLAIALEVLALLIWGGDPFVMPFPAHGELHVAGMTLAVDRLVVILVTIACVILLQVTMVRFPFGRALRAMAQDPEIAAAYGTRPSFYYPLAFGLSTALAGLAGGLVGSLFSVEVSMGELPLMKAFIVVIVGGLGSLPGAVLAGVLLGMAESILGTLTGTVSAHIFSFVLVLIMLVFRPAGLVGNQGVGH